MLAALESDLEPGLFPDALTFCKTDLQLPDYIDELARLEWIYHQAKTSVDCQPELPETVAVNPTLTLVPAAWKNLAVLVAGTADRENCPPPEASPVHVIIWNHPKTNLFHIREAADIDLLALKIIIEQIDPCEASEMGQTTVGAIHTALKRAIAQGILLAPSSCIRRDAASESFVSKEMEPYESTDVFTLQWHVTQTCDLHCRHCYDRSERDPMPYDMALSILDDFDDFCSRMNVRGQVTFTGGNPLLYQNFSRIYEDAFNRGFGVAILGNPTPPNQIEKLLEIVKPLFFQISLEGLEAHNDYIRGPGHFQRSLAFLDQLKQMDIYAMVMLTLTRDNLDQVLALGEILRDRADFFTFNRLSTVGEGKQLLMPKKKKFVSFLREYEEAAEKNPILGLKDNLMNIVREERGKTLFGGCTGYGCGAAFNFVSLLPDGEVHACRKFPSLIGNVRKKSLFEIYHSDLARKYRMGSEACRECRLNPVCRGCLAITYSHGLDIFNEMDPFCFFSEKSGRNP